MDRYKKTNLKFSGMGARMRAAEMNAARKSVRQQRFSLQRPLEETENVSASASSSKIPTIGNSKEASRRDMLLKWKEEKILKKRMEMLSKKPAFKVGNSSNAPLDSSRLQESKTESFSSRVLTPNSSISKVLQSSRIQHYSRLADVTSSKPHPTKSSTSSLNQRLNSTKDRFQSIPTKPTTSNPQQKQNSTKDSHQSLPTKPNTSYLQQKQNSTRDAFQSLPTKPTTSSLQQKQKSTKETVKSHSTNSTTLNLQQKQNTAKNPMSGISKPSTSLPQKKPLIPMSGIAKPSAILPQKKPLIPISGIAKPSAILPPKKPLNQPSRLKPVSNTSSKKVISKEKPLEKLKEKQEVIQTTQPSSISSDQSSMFNCQISRIEPGDKSFAPPDYVFCPPKIRSSWFDDEGPCSILTRVRQEMNGKLRTSTPKSKELKKLQELEKWSDEGNSLNTGESSSNYNGSSSIPCPDTQSIGASTDSQAVKLPKSCNMEDPLTFSKDCDAESSIHITDIVLTEMENLKHEPEENLPDATNLKPEADVVVSDETNMKPEADVVASDETNMKREADEVGSDETNIKPEADVVASDETNMKHEADVVASDETNMKHEADVVTPDEKNMEQGSEIALSRVENLNDVTEQVLSKVKNPKLVKKLPPSDVKENIPTSENNLVELSADKLNPLGELSVNMCPIAKSTMDLQETIPQSKVLPKKVTYEEADSVFLPNEHLADAPVEKSTRRVTRWRMEKPSLAQIRESPENTPEPVTTPRLNRRKGIPLAGFTPRRSARIALLNELKTEENIFDVKECFLDSPSVESASRMSMVTYDFDRLDLEAKVGAFGKEKSEPTAPKSINRKVSLLYTPPRSRASFRNKSIKEDLITFSPNVE